MDLQSQQPEFREVLHPSGLRVFVPIEQVAVAPDVYVHDSKTTCRYASKRCMNPRTTKRNGELHSFCEMHRAKANQNQRRLESKKKLQREGVDTIGGSPSRSCNRSRSGGASPDHPEALTGESTNSCSSSEASSPRFDSAFDDSNGKLTSSHFDVHSSAIYLNDDGDDDASVEQYSREALSALGATPDHQAWVASHYYQYHPQPEAAVDLHTQQSSFQGFASRPPYAQYPPLSTQQLMEWELSGDLIGTSVAYAQTLNL